MKWWVVISKIALGSLSLILLFLAGAWLHWGIFNSANEPTQAEIYNAALLGFAAFSLAIICLAFVLSNRGYPLLDILIGMAAFVALSMHFILSGV